MGRLALLDLRGDFVAQVTEQGVGSYKVASRELEEHRVHISAQDVDGDTERRSVSRSLNMAGNCRHGFELSKAGRL